MLHLIAGLLLNFNPLPRKEGDVGLWWQPHLHTCISIHSLVKRETQMRCRFVTDFRDFNPLPRKEGDTNCNWIAAGNDISIHSLVKRETAQIRPYRSTNRRFQSTPS